MVRLGVGFPEHRPRILRPGALNAAARDPGGGEDNDAVAAGMYERYVCRHQSLEHVSLYQFAQGYEVKACGAASQLPLMPSCPGVRAGLCSEPRSRSAVVSVYPRTTVESHGEEHLYAQLTLHMPWRSEAAWPRDEAALERLMQRHAHLVAVVQAADAVADELEADVQRIHALADDGVDVFDDVRPGQQQQVRQCSWRGVYQQLLARCWRAPLFCPSPAASLTLSVPDRCCAGS